MKKNSELSNRSKIIFSLFWHLKSIFLTLCFFIAIMPTSALCVSDDLIHASDNAIWLSVGSSNFKYKETDDTGSTADTERGWMPTISAGFNFLSDNQTSYFNNVYLAFEGSETFGPTQYNGKILVSGAPYQGTTEEKIWNTCGRFGKAFSINDNVMFIPYVELGFRYWDRNLGDLSEDYHNLSALGGLLVQFSPTQFLVVSFSGAGGTTFISAMTSTNYNLHFDLGKMPMWKFDGRVIYALTQKIEAIASIDINELKFGRSADVYNPTDGHYYYEPNSQSLQLATQIGIAYHF